MSIIKQAKDQLLKVLYGKGSVPRGLAELNEYFRLYGDIDFEIKNEKNKFIALSTNFRYGSIMTISETEKDLEKNIEDAILTSFSVPSSYAKEANVKNVASKKKKYAFA